MKSGKLLKYLNLWIMLFWVMLVPYDNSGQQKFFIKPFFNNILVRYVGLCMCFKIEMNIQNKIN